MLSMETEKDWPWRGSTESVSYSVSSASGRDTLIPYDVPNEADAFITCPAGFMLSVRGVTTKNSAGTITNQPATAISLSVEKKTEAGWAVVAGPLDGNPSEGKPGFSVGIDEPAANFRVRVHSVTGGAAHVTLYPRTVAG